MVPRQRARLARERGRSVRKQDLRLADAARVEEDLPRRRVAGRVLRPEPDVELAERDPARLAAPARVDDPALERQQPQESGDGLGGGLLLEARREAELARNNLEHAASSPPPPRPGTGAQARPRSGRCPPEPSRS